MPFQQLRPPQHLTVEEDGQIVAEADLRTGPEQSVLHAELHAAPGHHRPGTHADLVDAVVDEAAAEHVGRLSATVPAGDAEMLARIQQRCTDVAMRRTGATVQADGIVPDHADRADSARAAHNPGTGPRLDP